MARKLARKISKLAFFIIIIFITGHSLPGPESYISYKFASKFCSVIYDNVNAESLYDAYSFIDWSIIFLIAVFVYFLINNLIVKIGG